MKQFINRKALENTSFSANTIGPLAYLIHKMSGEGSYSLEIYQGKSLMVKTELECSEKYEKNSKNIDVLKVYTDKSLSKIRLNSKDGYLLFYNSMEFSNNKIVIRKGNTIEFNSSSPSKGDLYALNLLKPGVYEVKSKSLKSDLKVNVEYPSLSMSKEDSFKESLKLSSMKSTNTKEHKILPNQGLVIDLGEGLEDFNIELLKENIPKDGDSIEAQLKSEIHKIANKKKAKPKKGGLKKYQWKSK